MKIGDLTEEKQRELERIFTQLDHDQDGHLNFEILERKYCNFLNECQRSFFFQVYEILSESTFFGLKEFKSFVLLIEQFKT